MNGYCLLKLFSCPSPRKRIRRTTALLIYNSGLARSTRIGCFYKKRVKWLYCHFRTVFSSGAAMFSSGVACANYKAPVAIKILTCRFVRFRTTCLAWRFEYSTAIIVLPKKRRPVAAFVKIRDFVLSVILKSNYTHVLHLHGLIAIDHVHEEGLERVGSLTRNINRVSCYPIRYRHCHVLSVVRGLYIWPRRQSLKPEVHRCIYTTLRNRACEGDLTTSGKLIG